MKINLAPQVSMQGNALKNLKQLTVPLKDESKATIQIADNYVECLVTKGENILGGFGHKTKNGVPVEDIERIHNSLKENIKEGFDFFKELTTTIFKK